MLEIALLVYLCKKMGEILRSDKGWNKTFWMQLSVVLVYFASLLIGGAIYGVYVLITQGDTAINSLGLSAYVAGYVGVFIGIRLLFSYVKSLPDKRVCQSHATADA